LAACEADIERELESTIESDLYIRGPRPWADVRARGARGDGSADDTLAFQEAADALGELGGGVLLVPPGTYNLAKSLVVPSFVSLVGAGRNSIIQASSRHGFPPSEALIEAVSREGVLIDNLLIGGAAVADVGIWVSAPQGTEAHSWVSRCYVRNCRRTAIKVGGTGGFGCHVERNLIRTNVEAAVNIGIEVLDPDNMLLANRVSGYTDSGVFVAAGGNQLQLNHFFSDIHDSAPFPVAVRWKAGGGQIHDNYFDFHRQAPTILIAPDDAANPVNDLQIQANWFINDPVEDAVHPIVQLDDSQSIDAISNVLINGNVGKALSPERRWSVLLEMNPTVREVALVDNHFRNCLTVFNNTPALQSNNRVSTGEEWRSSDARGTATAPASGSDSEFRIEHRLAATPRHVQITPGSANARARFYVTVDASHIVVHYASAPLNDSDLIWYWQASL
jgi:hypothetical protein